MAVQTARASGPQAELTKQTAKDGLPYFVLIASNGEPLMSGETYYDESNADRARAAILEAFSQVLEGSRHHGD
jgi:uncharacterized protein YegP (UPF0339 family)